MELSGARVCDRPAVATQAHSSLVLPTTLSFCDAQDIAALYSTCHTFEWSDEVWWCMCCSAASRYSLYCPGEARSLLTLGVGWRRVFFDHIWPARFKWRGSSGARVRFDISVAVRFRVGDRSNSKLMLPLHQRLKVHKAGETLVEKEPEEFMDPLMNTVMAIPVLLPTSGRCVQLQLASMAVDEDP
jgi:hypothetical protein